MGANRRLNRRKKPLDPGHDLVARIIQDVMAGIRDAMNLRLR